MSDADRAIVEAFFGCISKGDIEGCMSLMATDCTILETEGVPFSGTYHGPSGFAELFARITTHFTPELTDVTVHDAGEFIVTRMQGSFTSLADERSVRMPITENYWVSNGKITRVDVYYKNPSALSDLCAHSTRSVTPS